jgi:tRNA isopentenyl-2-thiomethyl-A-37 hydroxylase MiaE
MKKVYAILLFCTLIFSFLPQVQSKANFLDTIDIVVNWVGFGIQSSNDRLADDIIEMIKEDPSQAAVLRKHIQMTNPMVSNFKAETNNRLLKWLYFKNKVPIIGSLIAGIYNEWKIHSYKSNLADMADSEIAKKYEKLRGNLIDVEEKTSKTALITWSEVASKDRDINNDWLGTANFETLRYIEEDTINAMNKVKSNLH